MSADVAEMSYHRHATATDNDSNATVCAHSCDLESNSDTVHLVMEYLGSHVRKGDNISV